MLAKFIAFSVVVIMLGAASYVFVSNNLTSRNGKVVITDKDITNPGTGTIGAAENETLPGESASAEVGGPVVPGTSRTLGDLSVVTTSYDGYGNKSETRVFKSHPRLRMVMVRTGSGGTQLVYVYGKNGGVKILRKASGSDVLSMTADQIANKAEFFETGLDKERRKPKLARHRENRLEPLSSSEIEMNSGQDEAGSEPSASVEQTVPAEDAGK